MSSCCRSSAEDHIPFACIEHSPLTPRSLAQLKEPGGKSLGLWNLQRDFSLLLVVDILAGSEVSVSFLLKKQGVRPIGVMITLRLGIPERGQDFPLIRVAGHCLAIGLNPRLLLLTHAGLY